MSDSEIDAFLKSQAFGVVGGSKNREKYGNKILRCYLQHHKTVFPVHPTETEIEGQPCLKSLSELPSEVKSLSIVTPPPVTEKIVEEAHAHGIKNVWMQPGAASEKAVEFCKAHQMNVVAFGPCLLVVLGYSEK